MQSDDTTRQVAHILLETQSVGFSVSEPFRFKSGMLSPVYVDNRRLPFFPTHWRTILEAFQALVTELGLEYDIVAGIESAGIPHSAALGLLEQKPSVFVRKKIKDHGTKKGVEGGSVQDARVLLFEDHVSTGLSSLAGVTHLRKAGARVDDCIAITSYGFTEAVNAFAAKKVALHTLTTFSVILDVALEKKLVSAEEQAEVAAWLPDPWEWTRAHESED